MFRITPIRICLLSALLATSPAYLSAQPAPAARAEVPAETAPERMLDVFTELKEGDTEFSIPGARWLQLQFTGYNLGEAGKLSVRSNETQQDFSQEHLDQSQGLTVIFNGDQLTITFAPGDNPDATAQIGKVVVGLPPQDPTLESAGPTAPAELIDYFGGTLGNYMVVDELPQSALPDDLLPETVCGTEDNREATDDIRVGRLMPVGCTGWLVDNGQILTAGHCIASSTQLLQFQVPASLPDGTPVSPLSEDQYNIDQASIVFQNTGIGNDWATLQVFPNTQTGLLPHDAQGATFSLSNTSDPQEVRVTGFGVDGPAPTHGNPPPRDATNQTNQTDAGSVTEHGPASPSLAMLRYAVDTQGGNSGSPVIDEADADVAVGIHTNGGCLSSGSANAGTSFRNQALWDAVNPGQ
ncbi:MAG: serine protease [Ruegeria sp.]